MNSRFYWSGYAPNYLGEWSKMESRKILNTIEQAYIRTSIKIFARPNTYGRVYVDLGCGPGRIIKTIAEYDKKCKAIIGVDNNPDMLSKSFALFHKRQKVRLKKSDILRVKFSQKVDVITCIRVLKYIPERAKLFRRVSGMLKPKGIFIFTVTNKHSVAFFDILKVTHYKDRIQHIMKHLSHNGFDLLDIRGVQRLPEFIYLTASRLGFAHHLYRFEELLGRHIGPETLTRTIYITAQKI